MFYLTISYNVYNYNVFGVITKYVNKRIGNIGQLESLHIFKFVKQFLMKGKLSDLIQIETF